MTIGGRYALRAAVGHGGMGTVWRAADTLLRRDVAVKEVVLPPGLAASDQAAMYERTLREARAAAALSHPAVVQVYDVVTEAGRPWIVMELLDARSLADMVIEDGALAPRHVAKIGIALLGALEVAHAAGVLHRDVKPANVLICTDGRCVLTDFGVARMPADVQLTTPGMVLGSPHFISPERAMGGPFGPPSDLFSLGVTLYTAVEGRPPFDKGDPIETMHAVVEDPPTPPLRAGALANVLSGLLEKDPAHRWDVNRARQALRELLVGPLASSTPQFVTDPYSVVPTQRTAPPPAPAPATATNGQIGGRAMLGPGESLTERLSQRQPTSPATPAPSGMDSTTALGLPSAPPAPGWPGSPPAGSGFPPSAPPVSGFPPGSPPGSGYPPGSAGFPSGSPANAGFSPGTGFPPGGAFPSAPPGQGFPAPQQAAGGYPGYGGWPPPAQQPAHATSGGLARVRQAGASLLTTVKAWPRRTKLIATGGTAALVLVAVIALLNIGGGPDSPPAQAETRQDPGAQTAGFDTQQHTGRGITVNVPKNWDRNSAGNWVDYVDPADSKIKVRVLVESFGGDNPAQFFTRIAENTLKTKTSSCVKPYHRVALRDDVQLAGKTAAELEYTCGSGDAERHGIWRAVIQDGKQYSFFLTARETSFTDSKQFYDEMVRSFQLNTTN